MLPLNYLLKIDLRWRSTSIGGLPGLTPFLPFVTTVPGLAIGITNLGQWALARYESDPLRPGLIFDPSSPKGLIFLCPLLDWAPRRVMDQVDGVASSAGITFSELWNEFPWRYAIRSALEVARRQYHIEAALDWLAYLGVAGEFEEELQILGLDPRNIVLPRPRLEDYER